MALFKWKITRERNHTEGSALCNTSEKIEAFNALYGSSHSLSNSTESLQNFVKNSIENTESIASALSQIMKSAEIQSEEVERSLVDSENLGGILDQAVTTIQTMGIVAEHSLAACDEGQNAVDVLETQALTNIDTSNKLHTTMEELTQKSNQMSKVLELIFQVFQNIQLLSLNASIEAARAGEEGRGFAVVAQEIRKLAQQSTSNSQQIGELLNEVQHQVSELSTIVENTRESSQNVSKAVEDTKSQFTIIHSNLSEFTALSGDVKRLLEEAHQSKNIVINNTNHVSSLAQESLAAAYEVARLSETQASSVLSVAGAVQNLQGLSREIKSSVLEVAGDIVEASQQNSSAVRIGYIPNVSHAPALLAVHHGLFAGKFGGDIDTKTYSAGPAVVEALLSNQLDVGYTGPGPVLEALSRNKKVKIISDVSDGGTAIIVRKDSNIQTIEQLKGKTIAIPQYGSSQHILLRQVLRRYNLKDILHGGEIRIVQAKPAELQELFRTKKVDAAVVQEPWGALLESQGSAKVLVDWKGIYHNGQYPNTVIVVNQDFYDKNPKAIEHILQCHKESLKMIRENRQTIATVSSILEELIGEALPVTVIETAMKHIVWKDGIDAAIISDYAQLMKQEGFLHNDIERSKLIETRSLTKIQATA